MGKAICLLLACVLVVSGKKPPLIKADALVKRFTEHSDTTFVINLWATWCAPCVKELPDLEKTNETYRAKKVKVLLVSIDFLNDYETKLIPFLERKKLLSEVLVLNETKPNEFIDKINPKWSGSIPATMIVNKGKSYNEFFEQEVTYEFLVERLNSIN